MAIVNPRNLYSGGGAVVNTNPHTNFLITALAKKQAQEDALNQYYRNAQERLSEKEMRPQDSELWQSKFNDFQDFYMRNKKAILNGNISANNEYNQRYRDLIADANKSKDAAKDELLTAQHKFSGKWQPTSDDINLVMKGQSASIYSPEHYKDAAMTDPYGASDLSVYTPDLDEKKYLQTITYGQKPSNIPVGQPENLGNWRMRQNYEVGYDQQHIKMFGDKALEDANTNKSVRKLASNRYDYVDLNPQMKDALNNTFKQVYGKDAETPADYYAAEVMQNLGVRSQGTPKEYEDIKARTEYMQGQINARQNKTLEAQGNTFIDTYDNIDKALQQREKNGIAWLPVSTLNPEDKSAVIAELPKEKKYLTEGDLRVIRGDDKSLRVFDTDGNFVNFVTRPGTNVKANQPLGQKAKSKSMEQTGNTYHIKGKQYSEKQLLDMGYNLDQIKQYKQ